MVVIGEQLEFAFVMRRKNRFYEMRNGVLPEIARDIPNAKRSILTSCDMESRLMWLGFGRRTLMEFTKFFTMNSANIWQLNI